MSTERRNIVKFRRVIEVCYDSLSLFLVSFTWFAGGGSRMITELFYFRDWNTNKNIYNCIQWRRRRRRRLLKFVSNGITDTHFLSLSLFLHSNNKRRRNDIGRRTIRIQHGEQRLERLNRAQDAPWSPNKSGPETWQFHALASIDSDRFRDHESAITGLTRLPVWFHTSGTWFVVSL